MLPHRRLLRGVLALALLLVLSGARPAAGAPSPPRVSVLTMGPGEHPFTRFGHNALLLEWPESGESAVYNYGTFAFDGLQGVQDFMAGSFRYWLSVSSLEQTLEVYGGARRSLTAQELELTAAERAQLFSWLDDNASPEHRYYDYDYYLDNCSTRVRDALDQLLGGELRRHVSGSGRLTFRQHTLRLVGKSPLLYFGLDTALGAPTDRPISRWEELFLPQELHDELGRATRQLGARRVPLVRAERELLSAERAPLASVPPARRFSFAASGSVLGLLLAALGVGAARYQSSRVGFGVVGALLGLVIGLLGCALVLFGLSKHWAAHQNFSLLACSPWAIALVVPSVRSALGRARTWPPLRWLLGASVLTTLCLLLLTSLGLAPRESLRSALLFLPLWAGWLYGAQRASRTTS